MWRVFAISASDTLAGELHLQRQLAAGVRKEEEGGHEGSRGVEVRPAGSPRRPAPCGKIHGASCRRGPRGSPHRSSRGYKCLRISSDTSCILASSFSSTRFATGSACHALRKMTTAPGLSLFPTGLVGQVLQERSTRAQAPRLGAGAAAAVPRGAGRCVAPRSGPRASRPKMASATLRSQRLGRYSQRLA
jgi:hypothetical protein